MGGRGAEAPERSAAREVEVLRDADRPDSWMLVVDGTPQSHVDLADPTYLDFEYVRRLGHVVDLLAPPGSAIDALHLGAGALTLARYVAATRPGSRQRAVDVDAAMVDRVRRELPWDRRAGIRVGIGDARAWLAGRRDAAADLVVADVFSGARTPAHLTSVEFLREAARALRPDGVYAANIGDGGTLRHTRAQVATARAVFPEVALVAEPAVLRGRRFGNLVLVAAARALPEEELARRAHRDPDMARLIGGSELVRFASGAAPVHDADARPSPAPPPDAFTR
ncbi:spermidine synthase [Marinitenerispora sediminis]|uniref:Spermine synthase n=1 Tax=Marinitenerispora sediminis TaxID=1931232 RepID=A0A368T5H0_9ACTN|nr:fused MFS/spermidine synthase [Marinitenerispora sediminis]RCV53313.1 spermine synthase [Marinitenerispora sediminis]RCV58529.1 spermine synthase [Marinitenerispora sediminis]RCV58854.1 spermine synthase [Marinitenerispora sediminis]